MLLSCVAVDETELWFGGVLRMRGFSLFLARLAISSRSGDFAINNKIEMIDQLF